MEKKPTGRPRLEVDLDLASRLASIMCTGEEIADVLQVSYKTVERRVEEETGLGFGEWIKRHQAVGKSSLRRMQWKTAENGNVTMQIWLGKQYLGQADKVEQVGETFNKAAEQFEKALRKASKALWSDEE